MRHMLEATPSGVGRQSVARYASEGLKKRKQKALSELNTT